MKLLELLDLAAKIESFRKEGYRNAQGILEGLIALCHGREAVGYTSTSKESVLPFELQEEVQGEYVVFDCCPHYPGVSMSTFETIVDVQDYLTGTASILNTFTGFSLVFNNGIQLKYTVWYVNESGEKVRFKKEQQKDFGKNYPFAQVEWENA